jgi:hypothetical protein
MCETTRDVLVCMSEEDFLRHAEDCDVEDRVFERLEKDGIVEHARSRRQEDWSRLATQIVGGEYMPRTE